MNDKVDLRLHERGAFPARWAGYHLPGITSGNHARLAVAAVMKEIVLVTQALDLQTGKDRLRLIWTSRHG